MTLQISIAHKDRTRTYILTPSREQDGKSIARGNWRAVISRSMKNPVRRQYIIQCVGRVLKYELRCLCSDSHSSILASNARDALMSFSWKQLMMEAKDCMPILIQLLSKCVKTPTKRENNVPVIGLIISILAKQRRPQFSLFQKIISLLLYSGRCSKKVNL